MNKTDIAVVWLSICLSVVQWQLYKAVKAQAYAEGRLAVYATQTTSPADGVCYARNGKC